MDGQDEEVDFLIINKGLEIIIQSIRNTVKGQMDENSMVNGFALLVQLYELEKRLKIETDRYILKQP